MSDGITVIGAGSVGVSAALHLQQRGWQVTLIDRAGAGQETSYGNAGVINAGSMVTLNSPDLHKSLASLLSNRKPDLRFRWSYVLRRLPWMLAFLKASKSNSAARSAAALALLTQPALDEHKALMQRVGNMHRLTERGWLKVYRSGAGYTESSFLAQQHQKFGIEVERLTADHIRSLEPALKPIFNSGYLLAGAGQINNPGALISEYAEQFVRDGGDFRQVGVNGLSAHGNGYQLDTDAGPLQCDRLVIAAGPWSADLMAMLNLYVPLGYERGYHMQFHTGDGPALTRSVHDVQGGYIIGPMEHGLRVTCGVELDHRDAPSNTAQLDQVMPAINEALNIGERTDHPVWRGCRPTLPDSVPIIDQAPGHSSLWLAFGHQHIGLMTGPITGRLLAQQISGEPTEIDMSGFSAQRYVRAMTRAERRRSGV